MPDAGRPGRSCHRARVPELRLRRHVGPEERDAERPVRARERRLDAGGILQIGRDQFDVRKRRECARGSRVRVARERAGSELAAGVAGDGADEPAALGSGRAHHRDCLLLGHAQTAAGLTLALSRKTLSGS